MIYIDYPPAINLKKFGGAETIVKKVLNEYNVDDFVDVSFLSTIEFVKCILKARDDGLIFAYLPIRSRLLLYFISLIFNICVFRISLGLSESENKSKLLIFIEKLLIRDFKIITINQSEHNYLNKLDVKCEYIFPKSQFENVRLVKKQEALTFGFVGRWDPLKGTESFIEFAHDLFSNYDNVNVICLTYGRSDIEVENSSSDGIIFYDFDRVIYETSFEEIVRQIDVAYFDYLSLDGTTNPPLLPIELCSMGATVLLKPIGDLSDLFSDYRFKYLPYDTSEIKFLINEMMNKREEIMKYNIEFYNKMKLKHENT